MANVCSEAGALLVLDFSFRPHSELSTAYDAYEVLTSTGVSFIGIEDTGKTWATHDLKVGLTVTSDDIAGLTHRLHDELLLNISPIVLWFLTELIGDTGRRGLSEVVRAPLQQHRDLIAGALPQSSVSIQYASPNVPLMVVDLSAAGLSLIHI